MDTITQDEFNKELDSHDNWRCNNSKGCRLTLFGYDLTSLNIAGYDLRDVLLEDCNLRGMDLNNTDFENAKLVNCDLSQADLCDADLNGARIFDCKGILTLQGPKDQVVYYNDSKVSIGCQDHDLEHWLEYYECIGDYNGYSSDEIEFYGDILKFIDKVHKKYHM